MKYNFIILILLFINFNLLAQNKENNYIITHNDSLALENIIVEKYYIADSTDYLDSTKNSLPVGSVTYRIFVDMKPAYKLLSVFGSLKHELFFYSTEKFFNDLEADAITGFNINIKNISKANIALDSWITLGAAARGFTGIPRNEDTMGLKLIYNRPSLYKAGGFTKAILPDFKHFNLDFSVFEKDTNQGRFYTNNGAWAAPGGVKGPTPDNKVLIAQITTNGKLSFKLNVQIGTPSGGFVIFVADKPEENEIEFNKLILK